MTPKPNCAEPFPIVDFSRAPRDDHTVQVGVILYGTKDESHVELKPTDVIALDQDNDELVKLVVDGNVVAEGVLVREGTRLGIRLTKIASKDEALHDAA